MHSQSSYRSCSLPARRNLSYGQIHLYLLELFCQAYCYNTRTTHKYTLIIFPRCLGKRGLVSAFTPHPLILSSSHSVLCIFLLLQSYFIFISAQSPTFPYAYESAAPVPYPWHLAVTCFQVLLLTVCLHLNLGTFLPTLICCQRRCLAV